MFYKFSLIIHCIYNQICELRSIIGTWELLVSESEVIYIKYQIQRDDCD
jgi:hypothetical protein